jgi:hypothetical protein
VTTLDGVLLGVILGGVAAVIESAVKLSSRLATEHDRDLAVGGAVFGTIVALVGALVLRGRSPELTASVLLVSVVVTAVMTSVYVLPWRRRRLRERREERP